MKFLFFFGKVVCCLTVCATLAASDSIELRNGRHLQGRYIGGTTTTIGFMTGRTVEYFATSDVLILTFDNNADSPMSGHQLNPMKRDSARAGSQTRLRQINASPQSGGQHRRSKAVSTSGTSSNHPTVQQNPALPTGKAAIVL